MSSPSQRAGVARDKETNNPAFKSLKSLDSYLVDAHLELVPGVGTLTARGLAASDAEVLGGEADRAVDLEVLGEGALLELSAGGLESLDVGRGEGDADAGRGGSVHDALLCLESHSCEKRKERKKKKREFGKAGEGRGRQPWADDNNLILEKIPARQIPASDNILRTHLSTAHGTESLTLSLIVDDLTH